MSRMTSDVRVWSQPIRDQKRRLVAFELLHRRNGDTEAHVSDDALATDDVIHLAYKGGGARFQALEALPGFVNVDAEMLLSSRIEFLPKGHVVLELLETVEVDERVVCRCRDLKNRGYAIALDDFCEFRSDLLPVLELADIVKVDLAQVDDSCLDELVEHLRHYSARLLAEKVDSPHCVQRCQDLHFDYYQGFFFDFPTPANCRT